MKVLLVNGSPHKNGCTYTALCEVSSALNENGISTDIFWIGNKPISGCIACRKCQEKNMGFIAMKALSGGLIINSAAAYAYLDQFDNVLPIWGIQREKELDEFISYMETPPAMTPEIKEMIENDRTQLALSLIHI